ncbi:MAG: hypothetical protein ABIK43_03315 [candidate division WOR-3 bacterium]
MSEIVWCLSAVLLSVSCNRTSLAIAARTARWRRVYDDAPIRLRLRPVRSRYFVGETLRVSIYAVNTSDREVLIRRNWREQIVCYHIHPYTGEQIEWPAYINTATWLDSSDVVRLQPGDSFGMVRNIKELIPEDAATFDFRVKLVGVKDYGRRFNTWEGEVWSNPIRLTVTRRPR